MNWYFLRMLQMLEMGLIDQWQSVYKPKLRGCLDPVKNKDPLSRQRNKNRRVEQLNGILLGQFGSIFMTLSAGYVLAICTFIVEHVVRCIRV